MHLIRRINSTALLISAKHVTMLAPGAYLVASMPRIPDRHINSIIILTKKERHGWLNLADRHGADRVEDRQNHDADISKDGKPHVDYAENT